MKASTEWIIFRPENRAFAERNLFVFCVFLALTFALEFHTKSIIELAHDEWKLNYGFPSRFCLARWNTFLPTVRQWEPFCRCRRSAVVQGKVFVHNDLMSLKSLLLFRQSISWKKRINYKHPLVRAVSPLCSTFDFDGLRSAKSGYPQSSTREKEINDFIISQLESS